MAQPPLWQDMLREHGLHFESLDAEGLFSCGLRAITARVAKSPLEWAPWSHPSVLMARASFSLERSCGKTNHASDVSPSVPWLQAGQPLPYQGVDSGDGQNIAAGGRMRTLNRS